MLTVSNLKSIAQAGGGLSLYADKYTVSDLKSIAAACKTSNVSLFLRDIGKFTASQLKDIAQAGDGNVIFKIGSLD